MLLRFHVGLGLINLPTNSSIASNYALIICHRCVMVNLIKLGNVLYFSMLHYYFAALLLCCNARYCTLRIFHYAVA